MLHVPNLGFVLFFRLDFKSNIILISSDLFLFNDLAWSLSRLSARPYSTDCKTDRRMLFEN